MSRSPAITAAWIAGIFAIVSPIATYFVTKSSDYWLLPEVPFERQEALEGEWRGKVIQKFNDTQIVFPAIINFEIKKKKIAGTLHINYQKDGDVFDERFNLEGAFLHDRFINLDYKTVRKNAIYFGSIILELSPIGNSMRGSFIAYGAHSKKIINGSIELNKSP